MGRKFKFWEGILDKGNRKCKGFGVGFIRYIGGKVRRFRELERCDGRGEW